MNIRARRHLVGAPFSAPSPGRGFIQARGPHAPQQPPVPQWIGPYYASDGAHVWRLGSAPYEYAHYTPGQGGGLGAPGAVPLSPPGGPTTYWVMRDITHVTPPAPTGGDAWSQSAAAALAWAKLQEQVAKFNASRKWTIVCSASDDYRGWKCPRGVTYPPVQP